MKRTHSIASLLMSLTLSLSFAVPTHAAPQDIIGDDGVRIVVTVHENGSHLSFAKCKDKMFLAGDMTSCIRLGKKLWYSKTELKKLAHDQKDDVVKAFIGDVVFVLGGMVVGGAIGAGVGIYTTGSMLMYEGLGMTVIGIQAGGSIAKTLSFQIDSINPIEQFIQTKILTDEFLNDKDIYVKDSFFGGSGSEFAERLESMLSEIKVK